ncbi:MAG: hypothetical protein MI922_02020, partial [Bacteroidales bacterium]|nr:hypothetical protein [Bacteroidales bacterium]
MAKYSLIIISILLIGCTEQPDLSDYYKKSFELSENGIFEIKITGTNHNKVDFNEEFIIKNDLKPGSYYKQIDDTIINIYINRGLDVEDSHFALEITKN